MAKKHLIEFLMKFDCSSDANEKAILKLIDTCIKEHEDYLSYALKLINHMIKTNSEVYEPN